MNLDQIIPAIFLIA